MPIFQGPSNREKYLQARKINALQKEKFVFFLHLICCLIFLCILGIYLVIDHEHQTKLIKIVHLVIYGIINVILVSIEVLMTKLNLPRANSLLLILFCKPQCFCSWISMKRKWGNIYTYNIYIYSYRSVTITILLLIYGHHIAYNWIYASI